MTRIIEIHGGPGIGKSTTAARIFAELKHRGVNVELAREYVKRWAWAERKIGPFDQYLFVGKQIHEESAFFGKVDYVVTDKPLLMDIAYAELYTSPTIAAGIRAAVLSFYQAAAEAGHEHLHVFLTRSVAYDKRGRNEDEMTARRVDAMIKSLLQRHGFAFIEIATSAQAAADYVSELTIIP